MTLPPEGFRLIQDQNRLPLQTAAKDPLDSSLVMQPTVERAARTSNLIAGTIFRHSTWQSDRDRVEAALHDPRIRGPRFWRFRDCGTQAVVFKTADDPPRYKVGCTRCHDRFCLPCAQDRARLIVANMKEQIPYETTRFLTLTLKHSDDPLAQQLERLYIGFAHLRRRTFWRGLVTGGIAFLELKLASSDKRWHPHLHVLVRGKYIPQKILSDSWLQITGDSFIVDIRLAKTPTQVYSYLAKYVTKGWGPGVYRNYDRLTEAIIALKGRKLLLAFGNLAHVKLLDPPTKETWEELGTLHEVIELSRQKVPWAMAAYHHLFARDFTPPVDRVPPDE